MTGDGPVVRRLLEADVLRRPVLRAAIDAAGFPPGSSGIDVGCGIGLQTVLIAEALGLARAAASPASTSTRRCSVMRLGW